MANSESEGNQNWAEEGDIWENPNYTTDVVQGEVVADTTTTTTTSTGEAENKEVSSVEDVRSKLVEKRISKALLSGILNLADTVRETHADFGFSVIPHSFYSAFRVAPDKLRQLWLTNNKLAILTGEIKMFTNLRILGLGGNVLGELPVEIGKLPKLEQLFLEKNVLKSLPNELGDCKKLATLLLDHNHFQAFPMPVTRCRNLVRLGLSHNKIKILPFEIFRLSSIVDLDLDYNDIGPTIPDLSRLKTSLRRLGLENNRVAEEPVFLAQMRTLTSIRLSGNRRGGYEVRNRESGLVMEGVNTPVRHDGYLQLVTRVKKTMEDGSVVAEKIPLEGHIEKSKVYNSVSARWYGDTSNNVEKQIIQARAKQREWKTTNRLVNEDGQEINEFLY